MAAVDFFLKIEGIDGESADAIHKDWIEISSFSWGETNAGSSAGTGGKVSIQDFHFVAKLDKASPLLMLACATGQHIQKAQLTCRKNGTNPVEFLTITLEDCLISSFAPSSENKTFPTESISLNFQKIEFIYKSPRNGVVTEGDFDFGQVGTP